MNYWRKRAVVVTAALLQTSCFDWQSNTFTLVGELPPNFSYWAGVLYKPEPGTNCTVTDWRRTMPEFNRPWLGEYKPEIKVDIRTLIKGCRMVVDEIDIKIFARWAEARRAQSYDFAGLKFYTELQDKYTRKFKAKDGDTFYGQCQWMFRTNGKNRDINKKLLCNKDVDRGERGKGKPFAIYTLDQLPGKTIKMNIRVLDKDTPGDGDRWVEFRNGWKRCMGKGFDDPYAFCNGNISDFSHFTEPNGEICTIYPGCKE